jgi:hypothetical protein
MSTPTRHNPLDMLGDDDDVPALPPRKPMLPKEEAERIARSQGFAPAASVSEPAVTATAPSPATGDDSGKLPRSLRKRKEAITVTVDPGILFQFDQLAREMGLSRASALGLAMHRLIEEDQEKKKKR